MQAEVPMISGHYTYLAFDKGRQVQQGSVMANKNLGAAVAAIKAKQARRGSTIMGSLAVLSPAAGAVTSDRLGPALAYVHLLQEQAGKKADPLVKA